MSYCNMNDAENFGLAENDMSLPISFTEKVLPEYRINAHWLKVLKNINEDSRDDKPCKQCAGTGLLPSSNNY